LTTIHIQEAAMSKDLSRREFLETVGKGTAASAGLWLLRDAAEAQPPQHELPSRTLGRTGAKVSILAFGCGSRFLMYEDEDKAHAVLNHAIDLGITYLDTAYAYGDGKSETRVGQVMKSRRKEVWLATKIPDRTRDEFMKRLEASLKRLQTDHVDLVHIHSLGQADDLAKIQAPDGALKGLLEAREQKMARFIGMTSHTNGEVMSKAIERHDLDCVQMALNASRNGNHLPSRRWTACAGVSRLRARDSSTSWWDTWMVPRPSRTCLPFRFDQETRSFIRGGRAFLTILRDCR
jgi:hypothetical protein